MVFTARRFLFFATFVIFLLAFLLLPQKAIAQYPAPANNSPDVSNNLHTYTQNVFLETLSAFSCFLSGTDPLSPQGQCLSPNPETGQIGYADSKGGALAGMGSLIGMTYNLPIHSSDYFNYLASNFGITQKAYAQSPGFSGLQPVVKVWIVFRDLAYVLFVLIFIVIGVAIMLRVKIDPRTVMTIQNQIPKIIIGLILVTLSFAIAGLLIDLMWVVIFLIVNILSSASPDVEMAKITQNLGHDPFNFAKQIGYNLIDFGWNVSTNISEIISSLIASILDSLSWGILGSIAKPIIKGLLTLLVLIILPLVIFFTLFKLWFTLIQSFVMILINVVIAPLWIMAGLLPSKQTGFGGWIKSMLSNISVFPVVIFMFLLGKIFMDLFETATSSAFIPPLIGDTSGGSAIKGLIALGILLATPAIANQTKAAFKSPSMNLSAMLKPVSGATKVVSGTVKGAGGATLYATKGAYPKPDESKWTGMARYLFRR